MNEYLPGTIEERINRGSLAVMNKVLQIAGSTVTKHAKTTPADKAVAARVIRDIRSNMVPPQRWTQQPWN